MVKKKLVLFLLLIIGLITLSSCTITFGHNDIRYRTYRQGVGYREYNGIGCKDYYPYYNRPQIKIIIVR